eukprot:6425933-Amphidinium_carterae.3
MVKAAKAKSVVSQATSAASTGGKAKRVSGQKLIADPTSKRLKLDVSGTQQICGLCGASSEEIKTKLLYLYPSAPPQTRKTIEMLCLVWFMSVCTNLGALPESFLEVVVVNTRLVHPKDVKWSVAVETSTGTLLPQGNQCEECWHLQQKAFAFWGWEDLCKIVEESSTMKSKVATAREGMKSAAGNGPDTKHDVGTTVSTSLEVERCFLVACERELTKMADVGRIKKEHLKKAPSLMIPSSDGTGQLEQVWVFTDPNHPLRQAKLKVSSHTSLHKCELGLGKALYEGQHKDYFDDVSQKEANDNGVGDLINKELAGHLKLFGVDEFVGMIKKDRGSSENLGAEPAVSCVSNLKLVGAAAAAGLVTSSSQMKGNMWSDTKVWTPQPKMQTPSPVAAQSGNAVRSAEDAGDPSSAAIEPTNLEEALDDADDSVSRAGHTDGDGRATGHRETNVKLSNGFVHVPTKAGPVSDVDKWKSKISLQALLEGTQDLRSKTGLERDVEKKMANEDTQVSVKKFAKASTANIEKVCQALEKERIALPPKWKYCVLMRHINALISEQKYTEAVCVLNPWSTEAFNWRRPSLSGLSEDGPERYNTYKSAVFDDILCKMVIKGADKAMLVMSLVEQLLQIANTVDFCMLAAAPATLLSESFTAWRCLKALLAKDLDASLADMFGTKHSSLKAIHDIGHGSGGDSVMNKVAASLKASEWWEQKLVGYMDKHPAVVEKGPKVSAYLEELKTMHTDSPACLQSLVQMGKHLGDLQYSLPAGACDALFTEYRSKIDQVMLLVQGKALDQAGLKTAEALLSETRVLYPLDSQLATYEDNVANFLQECDRAAVLGELNASCKAIQDMDLECKPEEFQKMCEALESRLSALVLAPAVVNESCGDHFHKVINVVMDYTSKHWQLGSAVPDYVSLSQRLIHQLAGLLQDGSLLKQSVALADALAVHEATSLLQACKSADVVNQDDLLDKALLLYRRLLKMTTSYEMLPDNMVHECVTKLGSVAKLGKQAMEREQTRIIQEHTSSVQVVYKQLANVAGGKQEGKDWNEDNIQNWDELLKIAKDTLETIDAPKLVKDMQALEKVITLSCHVELSISLGLVTSGQNMYQLPSNAME